MKSDNNVPWATRESTPVERILDSVVIPSSMKQESGLTHDYAGLEWHRHKDVMGHDRTGLMIERVLAGRMTIRQAAKELGIPMSTMSEHVRNAKKKR